jgi:hypothetical protein
VAQYLFKAIQKNQKKYKKQPAFDKFEKRELGLTILDMPKAPHAFVHFENKSEEERYMRIVSMI